MEKKDEILENQEEKKSAAEEMAAEEQVNKESQEEQTTENQSESNSDQIEIIEKLNAELQQTKEAVLRKAAEFENLKKRTQKERINLFTDAKVEALKHFLPIRDDLQRSLKASENAKVDENFLKGITMVAEKFERVLSEHGVEIIEDEMVPFDVDLHDAMLRQPAPDESIKPDTVLKVLETGYKIGDKVIRHAKVIVSQ